MEGDWWIRGGRLHGVQVNLSFPFIPLGLSLAWLGLCFALCCFVDWIGAIPLVLVFRVYIYFVNS